MQTLASIRQRLPYAILVGALVWVVQQLPEPWYFAGLMAIVLAIKFKRKGDPNETRHERKDRITLDVGLLIVLFSGLLVGRSFELAYSSGGVVASFSVFLGGAILGMILGLVVAIPVSRIAGAVVLGQKESSRRGRHVRVTGLVQGVFFRAWTKEQARELGVFGWIGNCADGSVEAHLEGPLPAIQKLISRMHAGPPGAHVDTVNAVEIEPGGLESFEVRH